LIFYGIESAFLAFEGIMFSSHNIAASLCCCSVDRFILAVAIARYDYNPVLNTIIKKNLWLVLINHEPILEFVHSKLPPS
jgi:hypothetical protein